LLDETRTTKVLDCPEATLQHNLESESQRDVSHAVAIAAEAETSNTPNRRPRMDATKAAVMGYETLSNEKTNGASNEIKAEDWPKLKDTKMFNPAPLADLLRKLEWLTQSVDSAIVGFSLNEVTEE
jgi:hypothetical protein